VPTSVYQTAKGDRLPSVTQIIGLGWAKGDGLIAWANREGLAGRSHTEARDRAAMTGTIAHELVLARMGGPEAQLEQYEADAIKSARIPEAHGVAWLRDKVLEACIVEVPLVSAKMGYGGTPDWYGLVDGIPTLLDIKTSAQVYAEHWIQLAAYRLLLQEAGHEVEQVGVLHLPRNLDGKGKATMKGADKQQYHEQAWRLCQQVYAIKQIIG
jgi:hypothetical protein